MLKDFASILINKEESILNAMQQLDHTAEKILFVVNEKDQLIGSLTDGDIRRWILKGGGLDNPVKDACFSGTYYVKSKYDLDNVKTEVFKKKINYVPVVDEHKTIVEFLIWDKLFDGNLKRKIKEKLDIPVIIMAGGKGTRLDPFTRILPKPLLPIGDKTILEIIIEKFLDYHINEFYISINHKSKIIISYFEELQPKYKISFLYEDKPLGTVGGIKQLENQIVGNLILTNCDIIIEADYNDLLKYHTDQNSDITIVTSLKNIKVPYGICEIESGGNLTGIKEKPDYHFLVNTGMYILKADVIKYILPDTIFHMTHLIEKVKSKGGKVTIYPISENSWIDTGEWEEYKKAIGKLNL